jgi:hypothetical protein
MKNQDYVIDAEKRATENVNFREEFGKFPRTRGGFTGAFSDKLRGHGNFYSPTAWFLFASVADDTAPVSAFLGADTGFSEEVLPSTCVPGAITQLTQRKQEN